jgi:hypothetical protein
VRRPDSGSLTMAPRVPHHGVSCYRKKNFPRPSL